MEPLKTISLLANVSRFVTLTFAAGMAFPPAPAVPSQTANELIGDACHNELQQREKRTSWSYIAERRTNNHVYREHVIETVDAPVRHLLAVDGNPSTSAQMKEENDRHQELQQIGRIQRCCDAGSADRAIPWNEAATGTFPVTYRALLPQRRRCL
ncbi:MAG: hypothetical protein JWO71_3071 [Candidatus Acidoferrum typicum]|nr:hypothetical protein [Candidatus Acidoferrum typicum]